MAKARIACQVGQRVFYAEVTVEVSALAPEQVSVEIVPSGDDSWDLGAQFGIELLLGKLRGRAGFKRGAAIRVTDIKGHIVDTTPAAVAFAAFHAMREAMELGNHYSNLFCFDENTGEYIIRSLS